MLKLVAAGYERVDQVEDRGQFAVRGGLLDIYPATEERAVRVELFDIEIESLRWFSTFTQRSLGEGQRVEIAPAAELAAEHRELAEIAALEDEESRPDVAELLPVDRFRELLALLPEHTDVVIAADEDLEPALRDHWDDVCAAFHDTDAHHLYVAPDAITAGARRARSRCGCRAISGSQPIEFRAQAAEFAARSLREAEPELEKLTRSGYTTLVTWPQHGQGERAAYNLAAPPRVAGTATTPASSSPRPTCATASSRPPLKLAAIPEHKLIHRRGRVERPTRRGRGLLRSLRRPAHRRHRRPRGPRARALRRLRHQDRRRRHPRLPEPRVPGLGQGLHAGRPAREDLALRRRRRRRTRRSPSSAARAGRR